MGHQILILSHSIFHLTVTGDTSLSCAETVLEGEDRHSTVESVQSHDQQQPTESDEDKGKDLVGISGAKC